MDPHHANPDNHHVHITPLKTYYTVFGALLVLTVVTVGVSYAGLPPTMSIIVAMAVACVKASLVGAWFMHLKYDTKFNVFCFLSSFWFIALFFIFTTIDLGSRDSIMEISGNRVFRAEQLQNGTFKNPEIFSGHHGEEGAHGDDHGDAGDHGDEGDHGEKADAHTDDHAEDGTADAGEAAPEFDVAAAYGTACVTCHGAEGDGNGPAGGALTPKPRDFTDAAWWDSTTDEHVTKVIKDGGPAAGLSDLMCTFVI